MTSVLTAAFSGPVSKPEVRRLCGYFAARSLSSSPLSLWPLSCPSAPSAGLGGGRSHSAGFQRYSPGPAASSPPPPAVGSSHGAVPPGSPFLVSACHFGPLNCECQVLGAGCCATAAPAVGRDVRGRGEGPGPHFGGPGTLHGKWSPFQKPLQKLPAVFLRSPQCQSAAG